MRELERVLVTGGAGFIGTHLVDLLVAEGRRVRVLEKPGADVSHLPPEVEVVVADLGQDAPLDELVEGSDAVFHLAANPNLWARDPEEFEQVNHRGTRRVLDAARRIGASRIVHVSTESILAPPDLRGVVTERTETTLQHMIGPYCRSKWLAEAAAREAARDGAPVVVVRPSIPVGPGDRNLGPLTRMIVDFCRGRIRGYLDGDLNLIDVGDVAGGIRAAAERGEVGQAYLLVHENWTILGFLEFLAECVGRPAPRWRVPYLFALGFAQAEEWLRRHVPSAPPMASVTGVKLTQRSLRFDGHVSVAKLGLPPMRSCSESVLRSVEWLRSRGHVDSNERPE